jgi:glucan biosynthesis protein C
MGDASTDAGIATDGGIATGAGAQRQHYIDWLRVLAVLLLFPFHVSRVFDAGQAFYVKSAEVSVRLSYILGFISTWHMQLLFLLAGASTYLALGRRTAGTYVLERVKRLLVPLVFGFVVLIPPQTWIGARFNAGYTASLWHYLVSGDWLVWNVWDGGDYYGGFGIGHLWFILILLVLSLVALPLFLLARTKRGTQAVQIMARGLANPAWWLLPPMFMLVAEGLPDPAGLSPFYYLVFFLLGYVIMAHSRFTVAAERYRWPSLAVGAALALFWILSWDLRDSTPDMSWRRIGLVYLGMLATWLVLVGLLGCGKRYLNSSSAALSYLAEGSYPVYILHQTVIVVLAFYLVGMPGPWLVRWLLLLAGSVVGTFALYEVVRRVGPLRFLFGMRAATRKQEPRRGGRTST